MIFLHMARLVLSHSSVFFSNQLILCGKEDEWWMRKDSEPGPTANLNKKLSTRRREAQADHCPSANKRQPFVCWFFIKDFLCRRRFLLHGLSFTIPSRNLCKGNGMVKEKSPCWKKTIIKKKSPLGLKTLGLTCSRLRRGLYPSRPWQIQYNPRTGKSSMWRPKEYLFYN